MKEKEHSMKQHIRIADIALIVGCLIGAGILTLFFFLQEKAGQTVSILYAGETIYEQGIPQDDTKWYCLITWQDGEIRQECGKEAPKVPEEGAYNLIVMTREGVWMKEADCRDQICVHHVPITAEGESIICLPHKLIVQMNRSSSGQEALDGMVR